MKKNFNKKILLLITINLLFQFNNNIKSIINLEENISNEIKNNLYELFFDYGIYTYKKNGEYLLSNKFKNNSDFTNLFNKSFNLIKSGYLKNQNYSFRQNAVNTLSNNGFDQDINNFKKHPDLCWAYYKEENNQNYFIMNEFNNNGDIIKTTKSLDINQN